MQNLLLVTGQDAHLFLLIAEGARSKKKDAGKGITVCCCYI